MKRCFAFFLCLLMLMSGVTAFAEELSAARITAYTA